jgi:hypothetical protein
MAGRRDWLTPYRRGRGGLYRLARIMGDVQPWLELDGRKILRRAANKAIGRHFGRGVFGDGGGGEVARAVGLWVVKGLFGLNRD